jgi:hypothetical protein
MKLNILYKGKGDQQGLTNYQGKNLWLKNTIGMVGCQEAQHTSTPFWHPEKVWNPRFLSKVVGKMYKNCLVSCKLENESISIKYNAGIQQGDNASSVLSAYIMHAFLDTLKIRVKSTEFHFFKPSKNSNLKAINGHLIGQPYHIQRHPF